LLILKTKTWEESGIFAHARRQQVLNGRQDEMFAKLRETVVQRRDATDLLRAV
jgi:hypothetical protein